MALTGGMETEKVHLIKQLHVVANARQEMICFFGWCVLYVIRFCHSGKVVKLKCQMSGSPLIRDCEYKYIIYASYKYISQQGTIHFTCLHTDDIFNLHIVSKNYFKH